MVVSINYRVNLWGFLAHPSLTAESEHHSSGNYALLDQLAALQWVQRNAAAFGGDPGRVTVFGESAGGTDITYLLASPLSRGLFHRAVIESAGYAVADFRTLAEAETVGKSLAEALGISSSGDVLAAMRAAAPEDLRRAWLGVKKIGTNAPNVDGWVLPAATARTFDRGEQYQVPLIIGYNHDEWTALSPLLADRHARRVPPAPSCRVRSSRRSGDGALPGDDRRRGGGGRGSLADRLLLRRSVAVHRGPDGTGRGSGLPLRLQPAHPRAGRREARRPPRHRDPVRLGHPRLRDVGAAPALRPGARRRHQQRVGPLRGHRRSQRRRHDDLAGLHQREGRLSRVRRRRRPVGHELPQAAFTDLYEQLLAPKLAEGH